MLSALTECQSSSESTGVRTEEFTMGARGAGAEVCSGTYVRILCALCMHGIGVHAWGRDMCVYNSLPYTINQCYVHAYTINVTYMHTQSMLRTCIHNQCYVHAYTINVTYMHTHTLLCTHLHTHTHTVHAVSLCMFLLT